MQRTNLSSDFVLMGRDKIITSIVTSRTQCEKNDFVILMFNKT